jgi:hypothetical protein
MFSSNATGLGLLFLCLIPPEPLCCAVLCCAVQTSVVVWVLATALGTTPPLAPECQGVIYSGVSDGAALQQTSRLAAYINVAYLFSVVRCMYNATHML